MLNPHGFTQFFWDIRQWGYATATHSSKNTTPFAIAFPVCMLSCAFIPLDLNNTNNYRVSYSELTNTGIALVTTSVSDIFTRYIVLGK